MKKLLCMLLVSALVLSLGGISQATSLKPGPLFLDTLNYEVGTSYSGGVAGQFYLQTATSSYNTLEYGFLDQATLIGLGQYGGLISALNPIKDNSLKAGEDTFGLLRVRTISDGLIGNTDSPYGDGDDTTLIGNDISAENIYWAENLTDNDYLHGMMYGGQDQIVECVVPNVSYRIWQSGAQFDIYLVKNPGFTNPASLGSPTPAARPVANDEFAGWFDATIDTLVWSGDIDYFRFFGSAVNPQAFQGQTDVLLNFSGNKVGIWDGLFANWYELPGSNVATQDIYQSWEIGKPFIYQNGWTGSEDSGKGFVVPEPVTVLGMFLGIGGLTNYIRKRKCLKLA